MTIELTSALLLGLGSFTVAVVALYLTQRRAAVTEAKRLQEKQDARFERLEIEAHERDRRIDRIEATWEVLSDHLPKIARRGAP